MASSPGDEPNGQAVASNRLNAQIHLMVHLAIDRCGILTQSPRVVASVAGISALRTQHSVGDPQLVLELAHQVEVIVSFVRLVENMEVLLLQTNAAEAVGTIGTRLAPHQVLAAAAVDAVTAVGAAVAVLAAAAAGAMRAMGQPAAVGAAVAGFAAVAKVARRTMAAAADADALWVLVGVLVAVDQFAIALLELARVHCDSRLLG